MTRQPRPRLVTLWAGDEWLADYACRPTTKQARKLNDLARSSQDTGLTKWVSVDLLTEEEHLQQGGDETPTDQLTDLVFAHLAESR